jgi:hypothetical protein
MADCGAEPTGKDLLLNFSILVLLAQTGFSSDFNLEEATKERGIVEVYEYLKGSKARLSVTDVNGVLHFDEPNLITRGPECSCTGPVCSHGWSFQMIASVLTTTGKRVGASGFDMNEFLSGGLGTIEEEGFEDVYSSLTVQEEHPSKKLREKVTKWDSGSGLNFDEVKEKSLEFLRRSDERNGTKMVKDVLTADKNHPSFNNRSIPPPPPLPVPSGISQAKGMKSGQRFSKVDEQSDRMERAKERRERKEARVERENEMIGRGMVTSEVVNSNPGPRQIDIDASNALQAMLSEIKLMKDANNNLSNEFREFKEQGSTFSTIVRPTNFPDSPPVSPTLRYSGKHVESELSPGDSSSVIERYSKEYMTPGTVFSVQAAQNAADEADDRTVLTAQTYLIDGFQRSKEIVRREHKSVQKLRPINGLPRPFQSVRLNFLANVHTALGRAISKNKEMSMVEIVNKVMRSTPLVPCDDLLIQLLSSTIDRHLCIYSSNAFKLPYIEIGMIVTEDSLVKLFDILQGEFEALWFQELKSIVVPKFHSKYRESSGDPVSLSGKKGSSKENKPSNVNTDKRKSRSILGF